jgi:hypothetical protein
MVNSKLRRHKVMEKVIKKLMAGNLPPRFKFKDTYTSIDVPQEYQQYLPTQQQVEAEFNEMITEEGELPTVDAAVDDVKVISSNLYVQSNTGNVGIGTASPGYTLDVIGSANVGALTVTSVSGSGSGLTALNAGNISSGTLTRPVTTTGGVSAYTLDVYGTANTGALTATSLDVSGATNTVNLGLTHSLANRTTDTVFYSSDGNYIYKNTAAGLRTALDVPSASAAVFTGNVGVGTTTPGFSLDVHGTANVGALTATSISGPLSGNASTATALQTARNINGVSFNGSANITVNGLNYSVNNVWLREQGDNAHFKQYGNSRQMVFRTDGTTEYASGVGGYPFVWMYGGDAGSNRRMFLNTSGQLWCSDYGWLHDKFVSRNSATAQTFTDNDSNANFTGHIIDFNGSGSQTNTANRTHRALLIDYDTSASGGTTTTNERNYNYAMHSDMRHGGTGDQYVFYNNYLYTRSDHTSGTCTNMKGIDNILVSSGTGLNTYIWGINTYVIKDNGSTGATTTIFGNKTEVEVDAGTVTNAYAYHAHIDRDAGTLTNGYLYYGNYAGTVGTKWGIYLDGETKNYFSGNVGIGVTTPGYKLDVSGTLHAGNSYFDNIYIGGSTDKGLRSVSGEYGTVQTTGSGVGAWEGYSIDGRYVFMSSDDSKCGIYNDLDNEWMIYCSRNAETRLYHNGSEKVRTQSYGMSINGYGRFSNGGQQIAVNLGSSYYFINQGGSYSWQNYPGVIRTNGNGEWRVHGQSGYNVAVRADGGHPTFTGSHDTFTPFEEEDIGKIVSSTGDYSTLIRDEVLHNVLTVMDSCPIVEITNIEKDRRVMGVLSKRIQSKEISEISSEEYTNLSEDEKLNYEEKNGVWFTETQTGGFSKGYYNAIGEGGIWVSNKNGNLINGDYITSSTILGYGQKQDEDTLKNYTVAKITCDCDFREIPIVKCRHLMIDGDPQYDENGKPIYENVLDENGDIITQLKFKLRYLLPDGTQITKEQYALEDEAYIAAFVGCTYHCG